MKIIINGLNYIVSFNYRRAGKILQNYCEKHKCRDCVIGKHAKQKSTICIYDFDVYNIYAYRPSLIIKMLRLIRGNYVSTDRQ